MERRLHPRRKKYRIRLCAEERSTEKGNIQIEWEYIHGGGRSPPNSRYILLPFICFFWASSTHVRTCTYDAPLCVLPLFWIWISHFLYFEGVGAVPLRG